MRDIIIGMAGHIDHGKTTVVKNLTGIDTDTLPEEKTRGMTIDLGFTKVKFDDGSIVGVVDVPGHEKFIKNMSAGTSGVDYLIMVIACDDGIMPQTKEHFQIAQLFGIKKGMVVLTKRDLVDEKRYEEVRAECKAYFKNTFLEKSYFFPLSMYDMKGYAVFKSLLYEELKNIELNKKNEYFRMDIDRVFSVKGFGCVVTGTIKSGKIKTGDVLTIYPQKKIVRVKGLESHNKQVESLNSGNRCAINLSGIESSEIKRGDIVATSLISGDRIECKLTLLENSPKVKNNHRIRLNIGTDEIIGRIKIYDKNYILGGESAFVQLELEKKIAGVLGEKGIIRNYSPISTIGGIELLDFSKDKFNKKNLEYINFLEALSQEDVEKKVENLIKIGREIKEISVLFGRDISLKNLIDKKKIFFLGEKYIHLDVVLQSLNSIVQDLEEYYDENRLKVGILKSQIKDKYFQNYSMKEYNSFLSLELIKNKIEVRDKYIILKDHKIKLNKAEKEMKEEIFSYYKNQGFNLFSYYYYLEKTSDRKLFEKVHEYMLNFNFIEYLDEEHYILKGFLKESIKLIINYLKENRTISIKESREILNNNRESAILILRKLDSLGITKNIDGVRVLKI